MDIGDWINAWIDRAENDFEFFFRSMVACFAPAIIAVSIVVWGVVGLEWIFGT